MVSSILFIFRQPSIQTTSHKFPESITVTQFHSISWFIDLFFRQATKLDLSV